MTTKPRRGSRPAPRNTPASQADHVTTPPAAAVCVVRGCTELEHGALGVCRPHHEAGWKFVKGPSDG